MDCPRCSKAPLVEIDRDGITLDRCDRCRGIWLDRGELEKLLARGAEPMGMQSRERDNRGSDDDDDHPGNRGGERRRSIWDFFD